MWIPIFIGVNIICVHDTCIFKLSIFSSLDICCVQQCLSTWWNEWLSDFEKRANHGILYGRSICKKNCVQITQNYCLKRCKPQYSSSTPCFPKNGLWELHKSTSITHTHTHQCLNVKCKNVIRKQTVGAQDLISDHSVGQKSEKQIPSSNISERNC